MADEKVLVRDPVTGLITQKLISVGGGGASVPTKVKTGETFLIPEDTQVLFRKRIRLEAGARVKAFGILVQSG